MPFLTELLKECEGISQVDRRREHRHISGVFSDSREVKPGSLFVALRGSKQDGARYIDDAIKKGAIAIVSESARPASSQGDVCWVEVKNTRLALAQLAAAFYPEQPKWIVAVTGTDGKTSTVEFTRQLWQRTGKKAASIGTLGLSPVPGVEHAAMHTTPDPVQLHKTLSALAKQGVEHVSMEASSHGLDQYRLDGVRLYAAAFTNLTRDHMDYHKDETAYFAAKARLFSALVAPGSTAVLNADDQKYARLAEICASRNIEVLSYGTEGRDLRVVRIDPRPQGQHVVLEALGKQVVLDIPLYGRFQVFNMLAALGLFVSCGGGLEQGISLLPELEGVRGRLQKVAEHPSGATIFVDYAHTPAALENVLRTMRPHTQGRLHVVFGCGGDRDPGKRPQMGEAASKLADMVIVTDDNPRTEDPAAIRHAVMQGAKGAKEVGDRRKAIETAVQGLKSGDILVIAGKGHEQNQIIGEKIMPFDDAEVAKRAVMEVTHELAG